MAIDPDSGDNGKLKYEIEKTWRYGEPATIYDSHRFIMESDTGNVSKLRLHEQNVNLYRNTGAVRTAF